MKLGYCSGREDRLDLVQNAGLDYIEPGVPILLIDQPDDAFAPLRERYQNASLTSEVFNLFVPAELKITGDAVDFNALTRHVETTVRRAAELGGDTIVFGSGGARNVPDGFSRTQAYEQMGFFCAMAADIAGQHNITIVIEPLTATRCNLITSIAEGVDLVEQVAHSHLALLADLYHMEIDGEPWANLLENAPMLKHIHIPTPELDILTTEGRDFSHTRFLKTLKQAGYDGRISIEDNDQRFADIGAEIGPTVDCIRALWAEA